MNSYRLKAGLQTFSVEEGKQKRQEGQEGQKSLFAPFALLAFFASSTALQKSNPQRKCGERP
jgi:hypothetical protein